MKKQKNISQKIEDTRRKIANLKFAYEHSIDDKNFIQMIEKEEDKLRELHEEKT